MSSMNDSEIHTPAPDSALPSLTVTSKNTRDVADALIVVLVVPADVPVAVVPV